MSNVKAAQPARPIALAALQARFRSFAKAAGTGIREDQRRMDLAIIHAAGYTVEGRRVMR